MPLFPVRMMWAPALQAIALAIFSLGAVATTFGQSAPQAPLADSEFFQRSSALQKKLEARITLHWQDVPLRGALERLARAQELAVWIDRRVDPAQELTLEVNDKTLQEVCRELAAASQTATTEIGELVYFGPPEKVAELRTLVALGHQHARVMEPAVRQRLLHREELAIKRLTAPRELISQLAKSMDLKLENSQAIPHDLWPESSLPPLSGAARLTLLLAGFDLTWEPTSAGDAIRIVPISRPVVIERKVGRASAAQLQKLLASDPAAKLRQAGSDQWLTARVEQHEALQGKPSARPSRSRRPSGAPQRQVYSLTIQQQPAGPLLRQLATTLGRKLVLSAELTADPTALEQRVSFTVDQVELTELLAEIARHASLEIESDEEEIRVGLPDR